MRLLHKILFWSHLLAGVIAHGRDRAQRTDRFRRAVGFGRDGAIYVNP
ncbi:MAG: hypothetical protein ACREQ2_00255 [Candidatus Binatia bacterium]